MIFINYFVFRICPGLLFDIAENKNRNTFFKHNRKLGQQHYAISLSTPQSSFVHTSNLIPDRIIKMVF